MLQDIFTRRLLKAHLGNKELKYSDTRRPIGHSGTQILRHLGTRGTLFSRFCRVLFGGTKIRQQLGSITDWKTWGTRY